MKSSENSNYEIGRGDIPLLSHKQNAPLQTTTIDISILKF